MSNLHPILSHPQVLRILFYPRPDYGPPPDTPRIRPVQVTVEPGVAVGGRLYPADNEAPALLFFHGNGEIAADYDNVAPLYRQLGITLLVMDYRGYGSSGGNPTPDNLLADAVTVFEAVDDIFRQHGLAPRRRYVMGRSLGSAAAIEAALHAGERLAGLIIESGFADTFDLLRQLGLRVTNADEAEEGVGNPAKLARITTPTLIIHGREDVLIPAWHSQMLYDHSAASDKRLVVIPGAGHNDLMMVGMRRYFEAVAAFFSSAGRAGKGEAES